MISQMWPEQEWTNKYAKKAIFFWAGKAYETSTLYEEL